MAIWCDPIYQKEQTDGLLDYERWKPNKLFLGWAKLSSTRLLEPKIELSYKEAKVFVVCTVSHIIFYHMWSCLIYIILSVGCNWPITIHNCKSMKQTKERYKLLVQASLFNPSPPSKMYYFIKYYHSLLAMFASVNILY